MRLITHGTIMINTNLCRSGRKDFDYTEPVKLCKFCKSELHGDDFGYNAIGYCKISCLILHNENRIALLERQLDEYGERYNDLMIEYKRLLKKENK